MSGTGSFDWYQLSKLNQEQPNIDSFRQLIKNAHFGPELSRVPLSLRQKLLIVFQNCSGQIKKQYFEEWAKIEELEIRKKAMQCTLAAMKGELQVSRTRIQSDRALIQEKRRLVEKLKEKIKKKQEKEKEKQKDKGTEMYFCPLCTRQDFKSRTEFSFHLTRQHANTLNQQPNASQSQPLPQPQPQAQTIPCQVKDLILSLKDKQIQLMQMMLNKKKQMQTMELQKIYEFQLKKIKTQANFMERKSAYGYATEAGRKIHSQELDIHEDEELKGQSQYLFYQQQKTSNEISSGSDRDLYHNFYHGHSEMYPQQRQPLPGQMYGERQRYGSQITGERPIVRAMVEPRRNDYYNIFSGEEVDSVDQSLGSPQKVEEFQTRKIEKVKEEHIAPSKVIQVPSTPIQYSHTTITRNLIFQKSPNPLKPIQEPQPQQIQSKLYNYNYTTTQQNINKSLSDNSESSRKYETVYAESRSNLKIGQGQGHVFNSGPLMDDVGDGSDFEDYFGQGQGEGRRGGIADESEEVIDEEIKVTKPKNRLVSSPNLNNRVQPLPQPAPQTKKPSKQQSSSINASNLLLQYSKDKSFLQISRSKDEIHEHSHSQSQSQSQSKDKSSDLIELSNSFSKRGLEMSKSGGQDTINLSDLRFSKLERQREMRKEEERNREKEREREDGNGRRPEPQNEILKKYEYVPEYKPQFSKYQSNPNILEQFKRQELEQIQHQQLQKVRRISIKKTENPNSSFQPKIIFPSNPELLRTNPGVLQQFLYRPIYNSNSNQNDTSP